MKRCTKCVMPDTRPGIRFNEEGVCQACLNYDARKNIDWDQRFAELAKLCGIHRKDTGYDCIIAVSGGKDSHWQVHVMKELMGMHPLLVSVEDNFPMTDAGAHNIKNISEEFGCDIISLKPNIKDQKMVMKYTFEKYGSPTWYIDRMIYTYPLHMAKQWGIPLLVYGENISFEYGGIDDVESPSAARQIDNGVAGDIDISEIWPHIDSTLLTPPKNVGLEPVYLSYFMGWNSFDNYTFAQSRGFKSLLGEWERTNHVEGFDQIDTRGYLVHSWMKYPKYGHAAATDYGSKFVRYGIWNRESAMKMVEAKDHDLDPLMVRDFCEFMGYSTDEFWKIVNKFYNPDLFEWNDDAGFMLKD